eukprot:TRINITY_DN2908_c0_g1_i17.p1 TRINITY_DN2908_c0_g1~~TRINITY_DN2908_c0_g1_i17.p1  ORF type:complete len:214 (-),score=39.62 TRINITY_DN2908_c0_g1_i17:126-767(-)
MCIRDRWYQRRVHGNMDNKKRTINVITLGNSQVGKTSLIVRYVDGIFNKTLTSTLGVDFRTKSLAIDGNLVNFQIWDTSGQERFRTVTKGYYSKAMGVLLVFDCTDNKSYEDIQGWMMQIENHARKDIVKYLVAAKCDEQVREVTREMGEELASEFDMKYFETSAFNGDNVNLVFDKIAHDILKGRLDDEKDKRMSITVTAKSASGKKTSSCC